MAKVLNKPITLWRISSYDALDGVGAFRSGGRWNSAGRHVVYFAESPAGAMLEVLVHLSTDDVDLPESYRLLQFSLFMREPATDLAALPFSAGAASIEDTRRIGDAWLERNRTPLARVSSVVMPHTWNYLLNPAHSDAADVQIIDKTEHLFDPRLLRVRTSARNRKR